MPSVATVYKCEYCDKTYKTKKGCENHEIKCASEATALQQKDIWKQEVENIRLLATDPADLVNRVKTFLLTVGLEISFTSWPSGWNDHISNSHSAPKGKKQNWRQDPSLPTGYPGFKGTWSGEIKVIDPNILGKKSVYFSHIKEEHFSELPFNFWYLRSGTGGGGERFQFEGILWVDDFPKMAEERPDNFDAIENEYVYGLRAYHRKFLEDRERHVETHNSILNMEHAIREMRQILNLAEQDLSATKKNLGDAFTKEHASPLPLPPTGVMTNAKEIMRLLTELSPERLTERKISTKYEDALKRMKYLTSEVVKYYNTHAEEFI